MKRAFLTMLVPLVAFSSSAQEPAMVKTIPFGESFQQQQADGTLGFLPGNDAAYACSKPPSVEELRRASFTTSMTVLTAEQAAKLKISFSGSVSGQFDRSQQVVVSQVGRMKECLAQDGKTRLLYGHVVRTTVLLSNYSVGADASLAVVAAQATIKNASNRVELQAIGVPDQEVQTKLQEAKNALGGSLKVETFGDFDKKRTEAELLAVKSTKVTSERLGVVGELVDEGSLQAMFTRAFAMQWIADGRDCQRALRDYKNPVPAVEAVIVDTYNTVAQGCNPDSIGRERAKKLLGLIEVRLR